MSSYIRGSPSTGGGRPDDARFQHWALFYAGAEEFLTATLPFVSDAARREEPVLVAVTQPRERALKAELGELAPLVQFADMETLGRNPARIIPAWRRFVEDHGGPGRPVRGVGEPIWAGRSNAELAECRRHEALLNLAFADAPAWELLCPYDTSTLDEQTLQAACHTHPHVLDAHGPLRPSDCYVTPEHAPAPFSGSLPEPDNATFQMRFGRERLSIVRQMVVHQASAAGLAPERTSDLVLAVNELAANSVNYGGGGGTLRIWRSDATLVCEVRDAGRLHDPLAGRCNPTPTQLSGRGLWLANQLCDLVQIRSLGEGAPSWDDLPPLSGPPPGGAPDVDRPLACAGTVVRVHVRLA
jgi:anti-sigma regulatory factor (Ser/Thr protein kinase)